MTGLSLPGCCARSPARRSIRNCKRSNRRRHRPNRACSMHTSLHGLAAPSTLILRSRRRRRLEGWATGACGHPSRRAQGRAPQDEGGAGCMISKFFIERPVLSNVIAILMILIGGVCAVQSCGRAISRRGAADGAGHHPLSRRQRQDRDRYRGAADRAAGQRRRGHALHAVLQRRRRHLYADGHLQDRHRPQLRAGAGAEPGVERAVATADLGAEPGRHRAEAIHLDPAVRDPDLAEGDL